MSVSASHSDGAGFPSGSLVDVLRWRAETQPDRRAYTFLVDGDTVEASLTYRELDMRARAIGARLQALGAVGERVMLVCPPGLEYVSAYWGCLYAGAVAVPAYPPRANRTTDTLLAIVRDSGAGVALATSQTRTDVERDFARANDLPHMTVVVTEALTDDPSGGWRHPGARVDTLAFLQYTSGSTGTPKGVMVSHGNLIANMTVAWGAVRMTPESVPLSWLPPFHDMGLISGVIHPVFAGLPALLMPPSAFIQRPARWLRAISRYRVTHSGGPPFAYDYCLRKITPEQLEGIDLSCWGTAYVGAEPIRVETLERFAAAYAPFGLQLSALLPCYGMAEATLMVSGGPHRDRPASFVVDAGALEENRVVAPRSSGARVLAGSGQPLDDTTVVIVDPERARRRAPGEVGEIWVSSPSVAQGYWNKPVESEQTFRAHLADTGEGPFLRTGDLGFVDDGEVYVTGRHKDLIILKGKNHYPQDFEQTVEQCHPALRPSGVAAFSLEGEDGEQLVVVQEVEATHVRQLDADAVIGVIRQAVAEAHDVTCGAVILLRPGSIPKTSSGKIRRRACRDAYLADTLPVVAAWTHPGFAPRLARAQEPPVPQPADAPELPVPQPADAKASPAVERTGPPPDEIQRWLVARLAELLQVDAQTIDVREPFARYGVTSVEAVGLSGDLEAWLGRRLSPTLAYDYPSIEALARRLSHDDGEDGDDETRTRKGDPDEPIAVVGLGCRLPGASSPDQLWQLLRDGVDAVRTVPADRWPIDEVYDADPDAPGKMSTRWGGFLDRVDGFDADFFRIAAREAVRMDPQQRLLLEVSWEALEDAGQAADRLEGSRTGVFMGMCSADYARLHLTSGNTAEIDAYSGTGVAFSVAIGRISYVLGLRGPNLAVDTSCSSSLVAVHLACQSLRSGECELALAGGVNMMLSPETSIFLSKARALAPDGRCKTFSAAADGYARGEGCGVVVLKRLSDALAAGDRVLALIRGSAINHDGHSNGLTAPNGPSQEAVIRDALAQAGVEPREVEYVEAHGTGTALGDPIEVQSLAAVLGQDRPADHPVALGSIKTNIGHLEAAAGIAGLVKVVLSLQRGMIPPLLHLQEPSPYIPWNELPFVLPTTLTPWPRGVGRRIAGVSAFGFSGTNAHVILEEAPGRLPATQDTAPIGDEAVLLPLSARDPAALCALAEAYRGLLGPGGSAAALHDICYTASARRSHHGHRVAVFGRSREELIDGLDAFLREEAHPGLLVGHGDNDPHAPAHGSGARLLDLARAYVGGETPDWRAIYPSSGRCVSLPHYPWQRERFWVTDQRPVTAARAPQARSLSIPGGHPLLGRHTQLATQPGAHIWESDLDAEAVPYLRDHRVGGLVVLPAAAFVDLALVAARQALGQADVSLEAISIGQALTFPAGWVGRMQLVLTQDAVGAATFRVFSRPASTSSGVGSSGGAWTLHAEGRAVAGSDSPVALPYDPPAAIQARCPTQIDGAALYAALASRGLKYGPAFRRVEQVWCGTGEALGRLQPLQVGEADLLTPTVLDACFQLIGPAFGEMTAASSDELFLPIGLDRFQLLSPDGLRGAVWCHAVVRPAASATDIAGDLRLFDEDGRVVSELFGLRIRRLVAVQTETEISRLLTAATPGESGEVRSDAADLHSGQPRLGGPEVPSLPLSGADSGVGSETRRALLAATVSERPVLIETYLTELVARAVGRPAARIDRDRPLSDLGLDSLMAMELRNRIDTDLGIVVPLTTFLMGPSVGDLVSELAADDAWHHIGDVDGVLRPSPVPAGEPLGVDLPLSHGQRALWLTHQLAPYSTAYHIMFAARLIGEVDVAAMASAVRMLVDRHSSLRTTYSISGGSQPIQRVQAHVDGCFSVVNAAGWSESDLRAQINADADRAFDLERGPLLQITLFQRTDAADVLLLTVHHLAVDFWSLEVLVDELRTLYDAARAGRVASLPSTRQYVDFVSWQAEMLAGPAGERHWSYWQQKLGGELPRLAFPTDRPRPRVQTYRGALFDFTLSEQLTERLRELGRSEGATLYATLLAAFSALLARYTGQQDLLIGSPMAGRGRSDFERTVGYLVNVVPLRADLTGQPTFRELLRRMRATLLEALDHQDYPFSRLVEQLQPQRDPGQSPLVQVLFIWYRSALLEASADIHGRGAGVASPPEMAGQQRSLTPDVFAWEQRGAPYDLMLLMTEAQDALIGRVQYNADLYDAVTIARLAEHFRRLLESVVAAPDQLLGTARMLTAAERVQQLVSWNDTRAAYPSDSCLHELFEAQVTRTPDAVALIWGAERLTYRELNRRSNRVARRLQVLGVGPEVLVGVCVERTPAMVVGLLAVLKAGGAYVPLDPAYPEARRSFMLSDSRAPVLLTQQSLVATLSVHGRAVVCLDDPALLADASDDDVPMSGVTPSNLAYVIYTSGSTGEPKGVAIEHRGPVALAAWARDHFGVESLGGVLASTSICFDLSVFELFVPLSWGGTVILAEHVLELPRLPAADQVTLVNTVPSAMAELLRDYRLPASVRVVNLGGEVLPAALGQALYGQEGVGEVYNLYGPTEDTVYSTWALVERGSSEAPRIGRPLANRRIYLLDEHLQLAPVGVTGEVYTAGVGVARGYLNRPELTAERFVPSPFGDEAGERLYRVGDLARYGADGSLELLGRVDHQVKIRGFRIELGEIEAALGRHSAVREVVVEARDDRHGASQLAAYLIGDETALPTVSELRRFLQRDLPDYMLPSAFVWLDALPRTPNGKLDRRALPDPGSGRPDLDVPYVAPRTPAEALLAEIWAEVLEVERVGIHDSFFDLGGASFASVAVATRASEAGLPLTADLLFAYPTIADLTALAAELDAVEQQPPHADPVPAGRSR